MNESTLKQWRMRMEYSQRRAASELGIGLKSYQQLERNEHYGTGAYMAPDYRTRLAAAAIEWGVPPIPPDEW